MKNKNLLLFRTLLLSTSRRNTYRYSKDKKKRGKIVGSAVASVLLYAMLMAYCGLMCFGYGLIGLIDSVPVLCALTIAAIAFFMTVFKTNGYLFQFKEYDMLMSLPFKAKTVAASRFLYMYVKSLPWYLSISASMLIGYGYYARPETAVYPVWLILSLFLPLIPMLGAAFVGFLIARISAGFRKTNLLQTVITFLFVLFFFFLRFFLQDMFANGKAEQTLEAASAMTESAADVYLPARWFSDAVRKLDPVSILLTAGVSAVLFAAVFHIVGRSYRSINSALKSHAASKRFTLRAQKKRSPAAAIAFKEFRRMTGSTLYMTNGAMGEVLAALVGVITLAVGSDKIVALVTGGAPLEAHILRPAIPFIVYFFIGMFATTVCSPSLEGKNYWIVQSLPIDKRTLYRGKMLFNMLLSVPFMAFSTLCLCFSGGVPLLETASYLLLGFALCAFSTAWGCVCGVRHMRVDWENEVEVIKQGPAVMIYLLPNMFVVMILTVLVVFLGMALDHVHIALGFTAAAALFAALSYRRVMKLADRT